MITLAVLAEVLPPNLKKSATQALVDQLNNLGLDEELAEAVRQNFVSYSSVLAEGRFKVGDYLNAVKFVSFKLMELTDRDAYVRTFPDRYNDLVARGADRKEVSSYVSMYARGKLVNSVMQQSLVPFHVLNQGARQKALNRQVYLMTHAKSEMVQSNAANSVLVHTAVPEAAKGMSVTVTNNQSSGFSELRATLRELAVRQKQLIESGVSTKAIAAESLVTDAEVVER